MRRSIGAAALGALLALGADGARAGVPTMSECLEASDFIANAARSRDNGVDRDAFVGRLYEDFTAIRAFPPALRWFVKDDDDEAFLSEAAARVFDHPQPPERHRESFLRACLDRLASAATTDARRRNRPASGAI